MRLTHRGGDIMSQRKRQVGVITQATIDLLGLSNIEANKEICVGPTNISHMIMMI